MFRFSCPLLVFCWLIVGAIGSGQDGRPEVVLVRGGAGYWPGVSALSQELSDHGFSPRVIMGATHSIHARLIADQFHAGRRSGPVTIIGYSSGADYACRMSRLLGERNVPVSTLVLIESTLGTAVPNNVDYCINIYESRPNTDWIPAFRGVPVQAIGSQTNLLNLDSRSEGDLQWLTEYNHFTVVSNSQSHVMLRNLLVLRQSQQSQTAPPAPGDGLVPSSPPASPAPEQLSVMPQSALPAGYQATPKFRLRTLLLPSRTAY
ncbi:MAG TPA: hypothetical protein VGM98_08585 [Schlesneria sp.]|jgi:hypothetical protein